MYLGRIVEIAPRDALYRKPRHPYTVSLLSAVPHADPVRERTRERVRPIGEIGSAAALPSGCRFHPRCPRARIIAARGGDTVAAAATRLPQACVTDDPALKAAGTAQHLTACHFPEEN
jgi:oligopeptide transport system ATP-binding protein